MIETSRVGCLSGSGLGAARVPGSHARGVGGRRRGRRDAVGRAALPSWPQVCVCGGGSTAWRRCIPVAGPSVVPARGPAGCSGSAARSVSAVCGCSDCSGGGRQVGAERCDGSYHVGKGRPATTLRSGSDVSHGAPPARFPRKPTVQIEPPHPAVLSRYAISRLGCTATANSKMWAEIQWRIRLFHCTAPSSVSRKKPQPAGPIGDPV